MVYFADAIGVVGGAFLFLSDSTVVFFGKKSGLLYVTTVEGMVELGRMLNDDNFPSSYGMWCETFTRLATEEEITGPKFFEHLIERQREALSVERRVLDI
jgi:hypothetical protein